jgi:enoyl-CoA hydratase
MSAEIHVEHPTEGVAVLLLDNGPRNFSTGPLQDRLAAVLDEVKEAGTRVVVLGSAVEGFFVSHGHIGNVVGNLTGRGEVSGDPRSYLRVQKELDTGPMVSIAAVDGQAWGGGAELAWACDFRVVSESSTLGQPEVMIGQIPAGGATRIARIAGESAAKRLVLDGRPVSAAEAHRMGLVDLLVPPGTALQAAEDWATWLAGRAAGDLAMVKDLIVGNRGLELGAALRRETSTFVSRFGDETMVERALTVQRRYDEGADSYKAFGLPHP